MRSFRVWKEQEVEETRPVLVKLVNEGSGIMLIAVDEKGENIDSGNLLILNRHGLTLPRSVNEYLGLSLTDGGKLFINGS